MHDIPLDEFDTFLRCNYMTLFDVNLKWEILCILTTRALYD